MLAKIFHLLSKRLLNQCAIEVLTRVLVEISFLAVGRNIMYDVLVVGGGEGNLGRLDGVDAPGGVGVLGELRVHGGWCR